MKEILVISGKGGTGKTSLTAAFAHLAGKDAAVADCDVDAADLHLLLQPDFAQSHEFWSGKTAEIISEKCISCGKCQTLCQFDAIQHQNNIYTVNLVNCEGCGVCVRNCPVNAIDFPDNNCGDWYISQNRFGQKMVHAKLGIAEENSGKLVTLVKNELRKIAESSKIETLIIDGPPGIGCPVISSLSGATLAVVVTEGTISGFHDMERVLQLIGYFEIPAKIIINKYNLSEDITEKIIKFAIDNNIEVIGKLPYDTTFVDSLVQGVTITEFTNSDISKTIEKIWKTINN